MKEKSNTGLKGLFADRKKRYLLMLIMMLPFIVAIAIFGSMAYKEGKVVYDLIKGGEKKETKPENIIESMNYVLRDNATDIQKEYFAELKSAIEDGQETPVDDATIAGMVAKNYVTDFYTWTNKYGKYDVGGMQYIYDGEYENSDHYKENVYLAAKDGFYKYMSVYATKYGKENLLEVESVDVVSRKMDEPYIISEHQAWKQDDNGEWYDYRVDNPYEWYYVQCRWTYKPTDKLTLSQFADSINLAVLKDSKGRYYIVEASDGTIEARQSPEDRVTEEIGDTEND